MQHILLLPDPNTRLVKPICHHDAHGEEIVGGAEAAGGDVALQKGVIVVSQASGSSDRKGRRAPFACYGGGDNSPCIGWDRSRLLVAGPAPCGRWLAAWL